MKSVVVEGSTVAKAIELALLKAEKPEEFFIRILQEHSSGFLGFGGKKAKIVLFFKNNNKSDALFPTVLKQKEYSNFFDNKNLKNPTDMNVIDSQLNKNAVIGTDYKKKPAQHGKHAEPAKAPQQAAQQQKNKPAQSNQVQQNQLKTVPSQPAKNMNAPKNPVHNQGQVHQQKQVKPVQPAHDKNQHKETLIKPEHEQKNSAQNAMQPVKNSGHQPKKQDHVGQSKEDAAFHVAKVLKKVQSQKIVANVARPHGATKDELDKKAEGSLDKNTTHKHHSEKQKTVTPKFESYAEFMDAQADKAAAKIQSSLDHIEKTTHVIDKIITSSAESIISKIESLPVDIVVSKPVVIVEDKPVQPEAALVEKRPFIKMKRRPLSTDNQGVSGITRSLDSSKLDSHKIEQDLTLVEPVALPKNTDDVE